MELVEEIRDKVGEAELLAQPEPADYAGGCGGYDGASKIGTGGRRPRKN